MGIEKITDRIAAQAKESYDEVVGKARDEADAILANAKEKAEAITKAAEEMGQVEKEKLIKYGKSAADIDAGKIILSKKQEILTECFDEVASYITKMDEDEYIDLLISLGVAADMYGGKLLFNADEKDRIGQKVWDGLNLAVASKRRDKYGDEIQYAERFSLDEKTGDMKGGFIATYRATFADCTIESLVGEHRMDLSGQAAALLFG